MHALRNFAYLQALSECEADWDQMPFWIAAHNNFLDIAILEWCKLFTDSSGKHHWRETVTDKAHFESALLHAMGHTEEEFRTYCDRLRLYRNRFLAHLDEDNAFRLPRIDSARTSSRFLLQWLLDSENDCDAYPDAPESASTFYEQSLLQARQALRSEA